MKINKETKAIAGMIFIVVVVPFSVIFLSTDWETERLLKKEANLQKEINKIKLYESIIDLEDELAKLKSDTSSISLEDEIEKYKLKKAEVKK